MVDLYNQNKRWYSVFFVLLLSGCSYSDSDEIVESSVIVVEEVETIIDPETHSEITIPSFVRTATDGFIIFDGNLQKIFTFDYEGDQILSFGRQGRGPGEFLALTNVWILKDHYLLYDYNGAKMVRYDFSGSLIDEYPVDIGELTANVEMLPSEMFVHSARGEEGALLKISDIKNDRVTYFGEAAAGKDETSNEEIRDVIRKGEIPNFMKNKVLLGVNESGIFSFQTAHAVLQKFSLDGVPQWERDLKIPSVEGVFENFLKVNREQNYIFLLAYARDMHVSEYGAAILIETLENQPVTVAWVPNDGDNIQIIEFPHIEKPSEIAYPFRFRIAPGHHTIFFTNSLEGKVFKSFWPIEHVDQE